MRIVKVIALATTAALLLPSSSSAEPGAFMIPYGQMQPPTVTCSTDFVCEIQFAPGETVFDTTSGDKPNWKLNVGVSGDAGATPTLFFEPRDYCHRSARGDCDRPLKTNLIITTNRHTYEVFLLAGQSTEHTRYAFYTPELDAKQRTIALAMADAASAMNATPVPSPNAVASTAPRVSTYELAIANVQAGLSHTSNFDYNYRIVGDTLFRPTSVWNDGLHTYLAINSRAQAVTWQAEDTPGNAYLPTVHPPIAGVYTVDGTPKHLWLIQDVGKHVPQVDIYRQDKK
jgi:type IV secretion system protein VirB9